MRVSGDRSGRVCRLPEVPRGASAAPTQAGGDQQARPGPQEKRGFARRAGSVGAAAAADGHDGQTGAAARHPGFKIISGFNSAPAGGGGSHGSAGRSPGPGRAQSELSRVR